MKKFIPLGPNVIVRIETGEIKSAGGIIMAAEGTRDCTAREECIIEERGESSFDDLLEENRPKIGDTVIIARYDGNTVQRSQDSSDNKERRVVQDTRVMCIIKEV